MERRTQCHHFQHPSATSESFINVGSLMRTVIIWLAMRSTTRNRLSDDVNHKDAAAQIRMMANEGKGKRQIG
jgi:hypothetical protein